MPALLSVDDALTHILRDFAPLPAASVALRRAYGRVLAADVIAKEALPPFDNSSVDGFAVRAADCVGASPDRPARLPVSFDIPAGSTTQHPLAAGTAARIMTGAPIPPGADAIVMVEDTDHHATAGTAGAALPAAVAVFQAPAVGANIRTVGEDIRPGQTILTAGRIVRGAEMAALATLGHARILVRRRPRVAILSTGSELLEPDQPLRPGMIRNANAYALCGLVRQFGGIPIVIPTAPDELVLVRARFQQAIAARPDVIVSSAGVSVGAFDLVRTVMAEFGAIDFWKINLRPGKPLAYGHLGGIPFFGLPGNPVSAQITFDVFVRPALLRLSGEADDYPTIDAVLGEDVRSDGRRSYIRVKLERDEANGELIAQTTGTQSSGALTSMVYADGLLIVPEGVTRAQRGERYRVRLLRPLA